MCTYLACSTKLKTANGLGVAVVFVLTCSGVLNWLVINSSPGQNALSWLSHFGLDAKGIDLNFLQFLLFISIIAAFVAGPRNRHRKSFSPPSTSPLGLYLPLIAVNCAILGACLFAVTRDYPFLPNLFYVFGSGMGWWLAIALMAAIREKLAVSNVVPPLRGMGITFIMTGLMAMAFQGSPALNWRRQQGAPLRSPHKRSSTRALLLRQHRKINNYG